MSRLRRTAIMVTIVSTIALFGSALGAHAARHARPIWSANLESGNLSQWTEAGGGGVFAEGSGRARVSRAFAHRGKYSLALTVTRADGHHGKQAVRMFRWRTAAGRALPDRAVFEAWFLFPRVVRAPDWWNIMQWKTRQGNDNVNPTFIVNVGNDSSGAMVLYLWDAIRRKTLGTSTMRIVPGQWMDLRVQYHWSTQRNGSLAVYQNGRKVLGAVHVQTEYPSSEDAPRHWSVNNYTDRLQPTATTLYIDDASIRSGT